MRAELGILVSAQRQQFETPTKVARDVSGLSFQKFSEALVGFSNARSNHIPLILASELAAGH
jgi:hypothetical protein